MAKSHELSDGKQFDEEILEFDVDPTKGRSLQESRRLFLKTLGIAGGSLGLFAAGVEVDHKAEGVEDLKIQNLALKSQVLRLSRKVETLNRISTLLSEENQPLFVSDTQFVWGQFTNEEVDLSQLGEKLKKAIEESSQKDEEPLLTKLFSVKTRNGLESKSEPKSYYISRIATFRNILSWLRKNYPDNTERSYLVAYAATKLLELDSSEFLDPSPISAFLLIDTLFSLQQSRADFFGGGDIVDDTLDPEMKLMRDKADQRIGEYVTVLGSTFHLPEGMNIKEILLYSLQVIAGEK